LLILGKGVTYVIFYRTVLENVINVADVKPYAQLWKIAFHSLHAGEYDGKVAEIGSRFRNEGNVLTDETVVAEAIKLNQRL
jgi:hypothetical protein